METAEKIKSILKTSLIFDGEITADTKICNDLGADSFDFTKIMAEIEENYNIEISEEESLDVVTYDDLLKLVQSKLCNRDSN